MSTYGRTKDTTSQVEEHIDIGGVKAKKTLILGRTSGNQLVDALIDSDGHLQIDLVGGDIQIGAVELKDADSSTRADIELDSAKNALYVQSESLASETTASSIKTAVEKIDDAISGSEMQVDIVASLPAGTNAIGKLAANDGVDIGDVTINNPTIEHVHNTSAGVDGLVIGGRYQVGTPETLNDDDYGQALIDSYGRFMMGANIDGTYIGDIKFGESLPAGVNVIGKIDPPDTILSGEKIVASASTPEALATSTYCKYVIIQAKYDNTGIVQLGNGSSQKVKLYAGDSVRIDIDNLADVYVKVSVDGEGVNYLGAN